MDVNGEPKPAARRSGLSKQAGQVTCHTNATRLPEAHGYGSSAKEELSRCCSRRNGDNWRQSDNKLNQTECNRTDAKCCQNEVKCTVCTRTYRILQNLEATETTNSCDNYFTTRFYSNPSLQLKVQLPCFTMISRLRMMLLVCIILFLLFRTGSAATLKSTCKKIGYRSFIDEAGCDLMAVYVNRCSGFCVSMSFANPLKQNQLSVWGRCCRMVEIEMIDVTVNCGTYNKTVQVPSAKECACSECA
ncbi:unnamed protein product [Bursaphelenchus okinawaensis]|uniref:CTCK domain-containing protein n=1 Tax=Bursaphelenchus okinawaensis TaxID=465554 RepID=A0A811LBQ2_9BILA|nr:unnamed protein product [Bursaphelenchus okinawaensis]CAG9120368.1 unnamed protein product [Bursaphelenchus okinawaensis]